MSTFLWFASVRHFEVKWLIVHVSHPLIVSQSTLKCLPTLLLCAERDARQQWTAEGCLRGKTVSHCGYSNSNPGCRTHREPCAGLCPCITSTDGSRTPRNREGEGSGIWSVNMALVRLWAAGLARGAVLLRTTSLAHIKRRGAISFFARARLAASLVRPGSAQISGDSPRPRWRCSSQLIHGSLTAGPPSRPAHPELQHEVDVLVEGTPLPDNRRALCPCFAAP